MTKQKCREWFVNQAKLAAQACGGTVVWYESRRERERKNLVLWEVLT